MLREKRKHANYKPNRRLDAKSSRGMIYENEELRIRTININAEVERGQSEIKTLKREREQLRREIWTLRDEYDKLENLLRIKGIDPDEFLNSNYAERNENLEEDNVSECSECSCSSCCEEDCCQEKTEQILPVEKNNENVNNIEAVSSSADTPTSSSSSSSLNASTSHSEEHTKRVGKDRLNLNFDHLSVVAEESSEGNSLAHSEDTSIPINDLSAFLHKADSLSPLSYLQKLNPPLSHFENLPYDKIGDSVDLHGNILPSSSSSSNVEPIMHQQNIQIRQPSITQVTQPTVEDLPSTSSSVVKKESRLKHFFSPIRRKVSAAVPPQPPSQLSSQPDLFINNVLPNNMSIQQEPIITFPPEIPTNNDHLSTNTATTTSSSFQTGGNLEELLYDIENLSKDIMELQTHCADMPVEQNITNTNNPQKPFRSELNLVLSYPKNFESQVDENANNTSTFDAQQLQNPLFLQNLPSPFPTFPSSPITPPINFKADDLVSGKPPDFSHLNFAPIDTSLPIFSSNNSIFCTVSAPSTPALDRKCIDKFCATETNADRNDKKKAKRVSIVNVSKDDNKDDKASVSNSVNEIHNEEGEKKASTDTSSNSNVHHHSHVHKSHSHSHLHSQSKRRMSLDNSTQSQGKHKNHRQISNNNDKIHRRESNRSNSFKKRSRSDSTFAFGHGDHEGGGTSMSERYSNSIASSRESSTSLSLKSSGKRRISITSYGNSKKIPW
ncbi:hypothetical protein PVAND_011402 [Polypedilum vanderplanki]|uniref:Uncharacterized protein n=1 Tax=Polypedilum vanderplanki TaxID=319348 RepID=A0A9J6CJF8_POLVA|nr:hypothetical protein PVAND_011402 [Polypedilum vanderplanki]